MVFNDPHIVAHFLCPFKTLKGETQLKSVFGAEIAPCCDATHFFHDTFEHTTAWTGQACETHLRNFFFFVKEEVAVLLVLVLKFSHLFWL